MNIEITGKTILTGLLGSPVAHSISPKIHNEAFRQLGLAYVYLAFDVKKEQLQEAVSGLKAINMRGFNLTMPLKVSVLPLLDALSPAAKLAQSVNTVLIKDQRLTGHTTDGLGYMRSVSEGGFSILGKKMTLLGAGGAAAAICVQAALDGVSAIDLFRRNNHSWDRTLAFCHLVAKETGCNISLYDLADLHQLKASIKESTILTNATSVGMAPHVDESLIPDTSFLYPELIVSDIIYNPRETLLLKQAKSIGCPNFNGLSMLLYQGAEAFRLWTGQDMPTKAIKEKFFS
ncbi:shikimate dehydrogenase [Lachnospiraceae bacterium ZAX-1]